MISMIHRDTFIDLVKSMPNRPYIRKFKILSKKSMRNRKDIRTSDLKSDKNPSVFEGQIANPG